VSSGRGARLRAIVNRIGARRGLLRVLAGFLMVRVLGSALFTSTGSLVLWRWLAAVEMPFQPAADPATPVTTVRSSVCPVNRVIPPAS
jgi:hypothetical protein